MAPELSRAREHVFVFVNRVPGEPSQCCARSVQAEQPSVIGNLVEQSLLLARKPDQCSQAFANLKLIMCTVTWCKRQEESIINMISVFKLMSGQSIQYLWLHCSLESFVHAQYIIRLHFDFSFDVMDNIDIISNDSLSQFSAMVDGQD